MLKSILVSPAKAKANAKAAAINLCFEQRDQQIRKYQRRNPFSMQEWIEAFKCGWLRQHGLGYWDFPSPPLHFRKLWETSDDEWFVAWRDMSKQTHKKFLKALRRK